MPGRTLTDRVQGPLAGSIGLRAAVAEDEPFLYRVFASDRTLQLGLVGWDDDQKAALLRMQFVAQTASYRQAFPGSAYEVIVNGGQPAGRLFLHRGTELIRVVDIGLLPEHRNQGIGSALLKAVLDEAAEADKTVRLRVEKLNRAVRLYERLDFTSIGTDGAHIEMEFVRRMPNECH
jgi:ribosomal protein S18 acetylase RimI-like enzyme